MTPDDTTGEETRPVAVARKNFSLLLESEVPEGSVTLPLAQIRRDGAGQLVYDAEYIPPLLQIGASDRATGLLQRLVEILDAKADALARGPRDVAGAWLAHAIQTSLVGLRHHLAVRRSRPEAVYLELSRLAGALCTFALDVHPRTLPAYDHERLSECLGTLDRHIRAQLDRSAGSSNAIAIALDRSRRLLLTGATADKRCFGPSQWVLGVRPGPGGDATQLIGVVPQLVKVCSSQHIARLVKEAFPGLPLEHLPIPPSGLAAPAGTLCFRIGQSGPCWQSLAQTGEVGIDVPEALAAAEIDLWVLLETDARAGR
jgi:type VI secretion system protein ImpJ